MREWVGAWRARVAGTCVMTGRGRGSSRQAEEGPWAGGWLGGRGLTGRKGCAQWWARGLVGGSPAVCGVGPLCSILPTKAGLSIGGQAQHPRRGARFCSEVQAPGSGLAGREGPGGSRVTPSLEDGGCQVSLGRTRSPRQAGGLSVP